ncbi:MAG: hypothetical protein RSD26_12480 [Cellulosilyticaceae bacterium]
MCDSKNIKSDLYYTCSLIEYMGRKTMNDSTYIVNKLGYEGLSLIYLDADILHCENIEKIADEFIEEYEIIPGEYDNLSCQEFVIPSYWNIGKIYSRLILELGEDYIQKMIEVYNSWLPDQIDDYYNTVYSSSPEYMYKSYREGNLLE